MKNFYQTQFSCRYSGCDVRIGVVATDAIAAAGKAIRAVKQIAAEDHSCTAHHTLQKVELIGEVHRE